MSFAVKIQRNHSEDNALTKQLTTFKSVSGVLRDATSIIDPGILIEGDMDSFSLCNYITIPDFNRSYFVKNITTVRTGLIELSCHVDVLTSFASYIRANNAIIFRQENLWNLYLDDGTFKMYQNPQIATKLFPSGFNTQEFVLAVAG